MAVLTMADKRWVVVVLKECILPYFLWNTQWCAVSWEVIRKLFAPPQTTSVPTAFNVEWYSAFHKELDVTCTSNWLSSTKHMLRRTPWDTATFPAFTKLECSFLVSDFSPGPYSEREISSPYPVYSEFALIFPSHIGLSLPKQLVLFRFSD